MAKLLARMNVGEKHIRLDQTGFARRLGGFWFQLFVGGFRVAWVSFIYSGGGAVGQRKAGYGGRLLPTLGLVQLSPRFV